MKESHKIIPASWGDPMPKALILYYSTTGNTEKMARAVAEGLRAHGDISVDIKYYVSADDLAAYDAIIIGAPTYNHSMPAEIKSILDEAAAKSIDLKGKVGAAFGSYGWSGEAPDLALDIMERKLRMHVIKSPIKIRGSPDQYGLEKCRELGKRVAEEIKRLKGQASP